MATQPSQLGTPNVQTTLANLGQNKRMVFVGAITITVILALFIIGFVYSQSTSKGSEIDLVKRIEQDRAFEIISKLRIADINAKTSESDLPGKVNVKVYQKDFDKAALTLARSDLLQIDGFNLFDKSDWAASDYDKRIKMMRAVNGDLSRIVSRMTGIKWSTVRVNIPEPQLFSQFQAPTTATVQVELTEDGARLSRAQVRSVINLLVGYVPNLQKNNISIIDTRGETYSSVETEEIAASEILEETERINKIIQKRIEEYLEPLIGLNNFIVRVSSEISRKKIEESATTFAEGVVGQEQIGDERLGTAPEGVQAAQAGSSDKNYIRSNRMTQKYPSFKQKTISTPPGRIARISVAVAVNSGILPRISVKQIREGVAAITSPNTTIDDVKITVAEFATSKQSRKLIAPSPIVMPDIGNYVSQFIAFVKKLPRWALITICVLGILIILGSFGPPKRQPMQEPVSTVSQINKQFQRPEAQIGQGAQQAFTPQQPDLGGILSGLKEAAAEKPEFLASRLQVWLEEGTTAGRT